MRPLQRIGKIALLTLFTVLVSSPAFAQTCTRFLNVTDGDDANTGTTATTAWRSFEFAWESAPDGATVCTAAGEYFKGEDADGIQLDNLGKSVTFKLQTFASNEQLLFSTNPFTVDIGVGEQLTIIADAGMASPEVRWGLGVNNFNVNNSVNTLNFLSGVLDVSSIGNVVVGSPVTTINRDTDGSFLATPTFNTATRTVNITGDDDATSSGAMPSAFSAGDLFINTTAGTFTIDKALTFSNGGMVTLTGAGNATFASLVTMTSSGASITANNGSGTIAYNGGLKVTANGNLGNIVSNTSTGSITAASMAFSRNNPTDNGGTPGDADLTGTISNTGSGTVNTGLLSDTANADTERILVTVDNANGGIVKTQGTIGADLLNNGTGIVNLDGNLDVDGDVINTVEIQTDGFTLSVAGGQTYTNTGDITGSGTVELLGASTITGGGDLPNVLVTSGASTITADVVTSFTNNGGDAALIASNVTGNVALNGGGTNTIGLTANIGGNLTINSAASNNTVTGTSIDGTVTVTNAATSDLNVGSIGGAVAVNSGVATIAATTLSSSVSTGSGGGITFDGAGPTNIAGELNVAGTGTVTNTPGNALIIGGDLDIDAGTFTMADDITVNGAFEQATGSTFDFGLTANTFDLIGDFSRTGGTVIAGDGMLRFIAQANQTFQGGPNFQVHDVEFVGLGTHVEFIDGSIEATGDVTIGGNATVDLDDRNIRLVGLTSVMSNDGSYTAGPDGKIIFQGPIGSTQMLEGNGLYSNVEINLDSDDDNVLLGVTPDLEITLSGILTFQSGGIDFNGQNFDLSDANGMPMIRRNLSDSDVDGMPDGKFFVGPGVFNASGTDYDLEYFGAPPVGTTTASGWADPNVEDVMINTSGANALALDANHSFTGDLTVASTATFDLAGFTLTSSKTDASHSIAGAITGMGSFTITGSGEVSGSGTVSNMTVSASNGLDINTLASIVNLTVTSGDVSLGLDVDTEGTTDTADDTAGDVSNFSQTGGTVTLTTDLDIGENVGPGTFNLVGGTFANGDFDVFLHSALTAAEPGMFSADGTGFFIFVDDGTIVTDNDANAATAAVAVPRLRIDPEDQGGTTVTLNGRTKVSQTFDHTSGTMALNGFRLQLDGATWNVSDDADGYGATGTVSILGTTTANLDQSISVPNLKMFNDGTFTIVDSDSDDGTTSDVEVTINFQLAGGTVNQGVSDIMLTGAGTAFDYDSGSIASAGGELVFDAGAAQNVDALPGLSIPRVRIENDVTINDGASLTITDAFTFGETDSDLIFADDVNGDNGTVTFIDNTLITRDGMGTIVDGAGDPVTPIFPTEGAVDVTYTAAVATSTELAPTVGMLTIDPTAGAVDLMSDVTVSEELNLLTGNFATTTANVVTMGADTAVLREQGTVNSGGGGSNLAGGPYMLTYDITDGGYATASGEFPSSLSIGLTLIGENDNTLDLHSARTVTSFTMDVDGTFDLDGNDLTVNGPAMILRGSITDGGAELIINGDLTLAGGATIIGVDVIVDGNTTIDGDVTGDVSTTGDLTINGSVIGNLTFNGSAAQAFILTGDIFVDVLTIDQSVGTAGVTPTVVMTDGGFTITIGTVLNLFGGLLVTGDNNVLLPTPFGVQAYSRVVSPGELSHVVGNVTIFVPAGTPGSAFPGNGRFEYPVGSLDAYRGAAITFETDDPAITNAEITVNHIDERPTGISGFPIGPIVGPADFNWLVTSSVGFGAAQTFGLELLGTDFDNYENVQDIRIIRRLAGDVTNTWVEQGGTYSNFNTNPPSEDPLVRVTDTQGGLVTQGARFTFGVDNIAGLAFLQVIHAAANVDFSEVDVYVDGVKIWDNLAYCAATPLLSVDVAGKGTGSTATFTVDLAPSNSSSAADAVYTETIDLTEGQANIAVALDDGTDAVELVLASDVQTESTDPTAVDAVFLNAVSDGGTVDLRIFTGNPNGGGPLLLENVGYGDSSDGYTTFDASNFTVEYLATGTTDQAFASTVDLTGLGGQAVVVMATGMMTPPVGREASRSANTKVFSLDGSVRVGSIVTDIEEIVEIPTEFTIEGNYPNPFNPSTTLQFDLPETAEVTVEIVNVLGQRVMTMPKQTLEAGAKRTIQINASSLASGTYLYRLIAVAPSNTWVSTGTMTLLK